MAKASTTSPTETCTSVGSKLESKKDKARTSLPMDRHMLVNLVTDNLMVKVSSQTLTGLSWMGHSRTVSFYRQPNHRLHRELKH